MSLTFTAQIENLSKDLQEKQAAYQKESQQLLHTVFSSFLDACPSVKAVYWTQYAPSFNDGDPCVFSVHTVMFSNATDEKALADAMDEEDLSDHLTEDGKEVVALETWSSRLSEFFPKDECKALESFISSSTMKGAMEAIFGSSVSVIATKEGFRAEDYECGY
jgi:hypothetical protein